MSALLRRRTGGDRTSRRDAREVHRRRRDGRLRRPDRARGRRAARGSCRGQEIRDARRRSTVRIGVNTGEVVTGGGDSLVTGDAVNVAARLEQAAASGEVLIGVGDVSRSIRDAVEAELAAAGRGEGEDASRWPRTGSSTVTERRRGRAPAATSPLVGRERERPRARRRLGARRGRSGRARSSPCWAPPESGSRGSRRSSSSSLDATVVARPLPLLRRRHHLLAGGRGASSSCSATSGRADAAARRAARRRLARPADEIARRRPASCSRPAAAERPLVVVFDDLHWGEPTFLDLVEHVADWSRDAPILLLCLARPELLELRPGWARREAQRDDGAARAAVRGRDRQADRRAARRRRARRGPA